MPGHTPFLPYWSSTVWPWPELLYFPCHIIQTKLDALTHLGFVLKRFPALISLDLEAVRRRIAFLQHLGLDSKHIVNKCFTVFGPKPFAQGFKEFRCTQNDFRVIHPTKNISNVNIYIALLPTQIHSPLKRWIGHGKNRQRTSRVELHFTTMRWYIAPYLYVSLDRIAIFSADIDRMFRPGLCRLHCCKW